METKYDYVKGYCEFSGYNGMYFVKYEGTSGNFRKVCMACTHGNEECKKTCKVINNAAEVYPFEDEWRLKDKV